MSLSIHLVSQSVHQRYKEYVKIYPSRRAAFRAAKRDGGIPVGQHPQEVILPSTDEGVEAGLDERNVRLYVFSIYGIGAFFFIREDKAAFYGTGEGDQLPHFNSGQTLKKLKKHHYWNDDEHLGNG